MKLVMNLLIYKVSQEFVHVKKLVMICKERRIILTS